MTLLPQEDMDKESTTPLELFQKKSTSQAVLAIIKSSNT